MNKKTVSGLTDTAKCDSKDQHKKTNGNIDVFADGIEHLDKRCLPSFVYLGFHVGSSKYPEEHDTCKACAKWADVDGQHIHPVTIAAVMAPTNISATNFFIIDPPVDRFVCYHSTMVKQSNMNEL